MKESLWHSGKEMTVKKLKNLMNMQLRLMCTLKLITSLLGMCRWNFSFSYLPFLKPAVRTKGKSRWLDQGDWKTDFVVAGSFPARTTSWAIATTRRGVGGGGVKRRDLGRRNNVLTTCKAVTLREGQRIIALFPTVNIFRLFRSKKWTGRGNQKCLKNWKK